MYSQINFYLKFLLTIKLIFAIDSCWDKFDPVLRNQCQKGKNFIF